MNLLDGWQLARLGDLVNNHDGKRIPLKQHDRLNKKGEYRYYGASGIIDYVDDYLFDGTYLLISEDGANLLMRSTPIAFKVSGKFWVNNHAHVVQPRDGVSLDFLMYFLAITDLKPYVTGAAQPKLTQGDMNSILVPCPPFSEQQRIAAILSEQLAAVERARAAAAAQLEAAKALPVAYLREVFDSPEAQLWQEKPISDFAATCSGATPSRSRADYYVGIIPWVKTGELKDGIINDTEEHVSEAALSETSIKLLPSNTLLIAMYGQGQTRGRTGLLSKPATTNQACFAILPNPDTFDPTFLQFWFRYSYSRLRRETEGRGGNQSNLNGEVLGKQKVPLPPITIQKQIAEKLTARIAETETASKQLEEQLFTIGKIPAALLHQAFSGKL
jgi:type I restriction enzyme S subunit